MKRSSKLQPEDVLRRSQSFIDPLARENVLQNCQDPNLASFVAPSEQTGGWCRFVAGRNIKMSDWGDEWDWASEFGFGDDLIVSPDLQGPVDRLKTQGLSNSTILELVASGADLTTYGMPPRAKYSALLAA